MHYELRLKLVFLRPGSRLYSPVLIHCNEMTNVSSFEGLLACVLILICTCAHISRVKSLKSLLNWKQFGLLSIFHKAAVIGIRLQLQIGLICLILSAYMLIH